MKDLFAYAFDYIGDENISILHDTAKTKDAHFRKSLARKWAEEFGASLFSYSVTGLNNADLPDTMHSDSEPYDTDEVMSSSDIIIALTAFSATAPLMHYAKEYGLRAASMPGFDESMMDALNIDYKEVAEKVEQIASILRQAHILHAVFELNDRTYTLEIDVSNPILKDDGHCERGRVINLPSGEAFTAPKEGSSSRTNGSLPITYNGKTAVYGVKNNTIVSCNEDTALFKRIREDPAVGNIAEVAFGVLGLFGIEPVGKVLLDEKLGFHIALGRSDHFGGETGPQSFRKEENVWHQDFVYIPSMQEASLSSVKAIGKETVEIIKDNQFRIF